MMSALQAPMSRPVADKRRKLSCNADVGRCSHWQQSEHVEYEEADYLSFGVARKKAGDGVRVQWCGQASYHNPDRKALKRS